ncbi:MAG: response regulator [Clostridiales bacterium]|nr:response regulator [Clostridiales bacterium]
MKKKVLLADDSVFMRKLLSDILIGAGYCAIEEVGNGADAIRRYLEWKPDLVLMEVVMPEINGMKVLKEIRAADAEANVIMCSSVSLQEIVTEVLRNGARDYIIKPFSPERLLDAVQICLDKRV